jgi:hypothetical protein
MVFEHCSLHAAMPGLDRELAPPAPLVLLRLLAEYRTDTVWTDGQRVKAP